MDGWWQDVEVDGIRLPGCVGSIDSWDPALTARLLRSLNSAKLLHGCTTPAPVSLVILRAAIIAHSPLSVTLLELEEREEK